MKILLAPDSFKECLTAVEVCEAMRRGIMGRLPLATVCCVPMADGGEGTVDVLRHTLSFKNVTVMARGPLQEKRKAVYGFDPQSGLAVIESASACGLALLSPEKRNPMITTTRGIGEMVKDALHRGARRILLTIGGVATVDGGTGMARALGYSFFDRSGQPLPEGGGSLSRLVHIEPPPDRLLEELEGATIEVACDVTNPLLGEHGAARTYGPQKGATPEMVEQLEVGLCRLALVMKNDLSSRPADLPGAGAAGGLGAGLMSFLGAKLLPGVNLILEMNKVEEKMACADLVLTGEGRTDSQTVHGKVCSGVAALAAKHGIPCVILAGELVEPLDELRNQGVVAAFSLSPGPEPLDEAIRHAGERLARMAGDISALYAKGNDR